MALGTASARSRPYPRLLRDLIAALLFFIAFAATASLFLGQGALGALAGSGLILAILGFAIRNVVADTLSGIALGGEGPFRIGDWIDIDGLARGKVIEIGWRTTRILTRDATYMILPNSQIARQRITNYSAPKPQYRAQVAITLDHTVSVGRAREVMLGAIQSLWALGDTCGADTEPSRRFQQVFDWPGSSELIWHSSSQPPHAFDRHPAIYKSWISQSQKYRHALRTLPIFSACWGTLSLR